MATIIDMPKLSDTMSVGTLVKWHKKVGDSVENGDVLAEVETDKATMELENFDDGTLLELFVGEGDEVPIGSPLAVIGEVGEKYESPNITITPKIENLDSETGSSNSDAQNNVTESPVQQDRSQVLQPSISDDRTDGQEFENSGKRILISPLAKKIAQEHGINPNEINGSGPKGRIIKKDILEHIPTTQTQPTSKKGLGFGNKSSDREIPVSKMRSIIAQRLLESKNTIPHFYLQKEINASALLTARTALNLKLSKRDGDKYNKLTLNDIVLKACAETIPLVPEINSSWSGDKITHYAGVHLAFGVAVEDGLVTPVIRNSNELTLEELSLEAKSLINKARNKKLGPDQMSGSTFTVTNLGMYGIDFFSGIINPPNAAILSVGAIIQKPVVTSSGDIQAGETMMLGLSCDHRLVDGAIAACFLQSLAETLENPASMLV